MTACNSRRLHVFHVSCLALALALGLVACDKHQDPIGATPADDVATTPGAPAAQAHDQDPCSHLAGTALSDCRRGLPGTQAPPMAEPTQSPPPAPEER